MRVVVAHCEGLAKQRREPASGNGHPPFALNRGQRRELRRRHANDLELAPAGLDLDPVVLLRGERHLAVCHLLEDLVELARGEGDAPDLKDLGFVMSPDADLDRKSTRLNSSHSQISYAV